MNRKGLKRLLSVKPGPMACPGCQRPIDGEGYEGWDGILVCGDCMAQMNEDREQARWENTIGREDIFG